VANPTNIYVKTYGTAKVDMSDGEIAHKVNEIFDMRPYAIEKRLKLRMPIYSDTAAYGHMGRESETKPVEFVNGSGEKKKMTIETFTWEKIDYVDKIRKAFGISAQAAEMAK
jgi:S-adenosylmethionine synthetase